MTANLTVPADVWACQQPGVPFVAAIVEGESGCDGSYGCPARVHALGCSLSTAKSPDDGNLTRPQPPAWLVALRDARCEGCRRAIIAGGYGWHCPDGRCVDGRLLHDVRVEDPDGEHDGYTECRTVRCLVDVAEIRSNEAGDACHDKDDHLDVIGDGTVQTMFDGYDDQLETAHVDALAAACGKPPADWVGGYAVVLTEVEK